MLIVGISVDRGHQATYASRLIQYFSYLGQTFGGAGSPRDNLFAAIKLLMVYPIDNGGIYILTRGRYNNLAGPSL